VSFMYSYPNLWPLKARAVERIVRALEPFDYGQVYSAFWNMRILDDGKGAVARSAERYLAAIADQDQGNEKGTAMSRRSRPSKPGV
ncbi:MAG: hypothetical protein AB7S92_21690, partial [Parvibaculaceae bacterium]